jgi:hypothetical protein
MPETIGIAIITAVVSAEAAAATIAGTTITYSAVVGTVALTAASIGLQLAFATSGNAPKPENGQETVRQPIPPPYYAFGRVRLAGAFALSEADSTGNSHDVKGIHDGLICGFTERFWLHDDEISLAGASGSGAFVVGGPDGRYGSGAIYIETRLGEDIESPFTGPITSLDAGIWTADHRGDFTAQIYILCRDVEDDQFTVVYPHGLPDVSAEIEAQGCYDPRNGAMTLSDPASWETEISFNPVLQLIRFLTQERGGMGLDYDLFILPNVAQWIAAADDCEESVALSWETGDEARYESHLIYTSETENIAVINQLLSACDGWLGEAPDGSLSIFVGRYREEYADLTITDEIIRDFSINYGVSDDEQVNELQVSFTWEDNGHKQTDADPWTDEAAIAEFGRKAQPFYPAAVHSWTQARRLAKRNFSTINSPIRGRLRLTLAGIDFYKRRWCKVASSLHPDLADLTIEIRKRSIDLESASVTFDYVSIDPDTIDAWDAATEEGDPPEMPNEQGKPPIPDAMINNLDPSGTGIDPEVAVTMDDPGLSAYYIMLRHRLADAGAGTPGPWNSQAISSTEVEDLTGGEIRFSFTPLVFGLLDVQAAFRSGAGIGAWSAIEQVSV